MSALIPPMMRAAVLLEAGRVDIESRPTPIPEPDQVLVRVAMCGVCGSDVHYFRHGRIGDFVVDAPLVLGHEASGTIVAVGDRVDKQRLGERVSIEPQRPSAFSAETLRGAYNLDPDMEFYATPPIDGAFCEYVTIHSRFAWAVPDSVSDTSAALFEPLSVAIAACRKARVSAGDSVLVSGAGPIGLLCVQVARASGATRIAVTDVASDRLAAASRFGATEVHDAHKVGPGSIEQVDVVMEASGAPSAVDLGLRTLRPLGRAVFIGLGPDTVSIPLSVVQNRELELHGLFRYANTWPVALALAGGNRVDLEALVTGEVPLESVATALASANEPGTIKTMVRVQS